MCKGFWRGEKRFRQGTRKMIKTQFFYWVVILLVFLNTACVSIEHYGQKEWLTNFFCTLHLEKSLSIIIDNYNY